MKARMRMKLVAAARPAEQNAGISESRERVESLLLSVNVVVYTWGDQPLPAKSCMHTIIGMRKS